MRNHNLRPRITVALSEHRQLLAMAAAGTSPGAESLLDEMERANVVQDDKLNSDIVRMGSRVQYRTDDGYAKEVVLVYPAVADISLGRVSVLTPVGAALIGLRTGQSITWRSRGGKKNALTVLSVDQEHNLSDQV